MNLEKLQEVERKLEDCQRLIGELKAMAYGKLDSDIDIIVDEVCKLFRCSEASLKAPGRKQPYALARMFCYSYLYEFSGMSYPQIGRFFNRTHCAVIKGIDKINLKQIDSSEMRRMDSILRENIAPKVVRWRESKRTKSEIIPPLSVQELADE